MNALEQILKHLLFADAKANKVLTRSSPRISAKFLQTQNHKLNLCKFLLFVTWDEVQLLWHFQTELDESIVEREEGNEQPQPLSREFLSSNRILLKRDEIQVGYISQKKDQNLSYFLQMKLIQLHIFLIVVWNIHKMSNYKIFWNPIFFTWIHFHEKTF